MPLPRSAIVALAIASLTLVGCDSYPPANEVAACADNRLSDENAAYSVTKRSASILFGDEYAITYQSNTTADRAVVIYNRRNGPISTQLEITYGNRLEIIAAVDAIKNCARSQR